MSMMDDIKGLVEAASLPIHNGYAPTGARVPYTVQRPIIMAANEEAINGDGLSWDQQMGLYACGASVEASYNLALDLMRVLQGKRSGGSTLSTSMGYVGAQVEGHYESQVTVQLTQGGI
ncbi:tail terminator [Microbacterium phage Tinyman4]|jgi:hypothetical protein|nr:tail terminator [Microbacterium phage Tinyman4]